MQGNGLKLHHDRFRLDIKKNFFIDRMSKHRNRPSREVVEFPSLKIFKECADMAIKDVVYSLLIHAGLLHLLRLHSYTTTPLYFLAYFHMFLE